MSKNYFKNDYYRKKTKKKVPKLDSKQTTFECRCCKNSFKTQARFSNHDEKYQNYCSSCRKVCYICRCRHGGRGKTCSKYCADRYKKLRWLSKNKNSSLIALDKKLKKFDLKSLNRKHLLEIYGDNYTDLIWRSQQIVNAMDKLQDSKKLISVNDRLYLPNGYINKKDFKVYSTENNQLSFHIENFILIPFIQKKLFKN